MMKYDILTDNGWSSFSGIRKKTVSSTYAVKTYSEKSLRCTEDHRLYTNCGWMQAEDLEIGDYVYTIDGFERIESIDVVHSETEVYDAIEVSLNHSYYTNGILSHNCEFQGSSNTLIDGYKLKELVIRAPLKESNKISVYENPDPASTYVMVVDVSRGKGLDYSAFSVFDVSKMPYKQVCTFRDNVITPVDYAEVIYRIHKTYNQALLLIEVNDIGAQVSDILHQDFEVEELLFTESAGRNGKRISGGFGSNVDKGIRTTTSVKAVGCNILKMMIEQDQLIIHDFHTINELSKFSRKGKSYEAEPGSHDDLVMTMVLFAWLSNQTFFKEITDINTLEMLRQKTSEQIEQDLLPFGFSANDFFEEDEFPTNIPRGLQDIGYF